ncbi:MAG: hypothetical protein KAS32_22870 [Candidatus Peribacteraceae bacterium]|nr:hypothetical protein [Candidatus Peribacteraceae bacterium]
MLNYKGRIINHLYIESITCSVCGKCISDTMEMQEMVHINRTGGFGSIIGDMVEINLNLCQHCFVDKLGEYLEYPDGDVEEDDEDQDDDSDLPNR